MLLKFLLKIWPSLIPIALYLLWVIVIELLVLRKLKKGKVIDGQYEDVTEGKRESKEKVGHFSLKNPKFVLVIYLSLILMIISFLFFALRVPTVDIDKGRYVPSQIEDGNIVPAKIIED